MPGPLQAPAPSPAPSPAAPPRSPARTRVHPRMKMGSLPFTSAPQALPMLVCTSGLVLSWDRNVGLKTIREINTPNLCVQVTSGKKGALGVTRTGALDCGFLVPSRCSQEGGPCQGAQRI